MRTSFHNGVQMMSAIAFLGLGLAACGGGGDAAEIAKFTGTWNVVSGTMNETCPEGTYTSATTGQVKWTKGVSSDLVQSSPPCTIAAEAEGSTATGSGPACTFNNAAGDSFTLTITSYTFVVAPDGRAAQENGAGTLLETDTNGASETCTMNESASYQKLSD